VEEGASELQVLVCVADGALTLECCCCYVHISGTQPGCQVQLNRGMPRLSFKLRCVGARQ
jgi:hypothetical protein